ncbi:MAG: 4-hydroxyphenylacetate 3-hydroxylase [Thermoplasmata archaeon]|nr:4-hydroxyphenylacetate 3-hydroxylase [Thermoplasmata archaeon]
MKTAEEYVESIRKMRSNVYQFGKLIEDVTTHGTTKYTIKGVARIYEMALMPEYQELLTTTSNLTRKKINRYLSVMETRDDAIANIKIKRLMFQQTGTCTGGRCVGWSGINALWATTYEIDKKHGTDYHTRFRKWLEFAQNEDLAIAGAITDAKGNRALSPGQQEDKDAYLHVVEKRGNGVVVRGAKVMISGAVAANELIVMPTTGLREDEKEYAVAFAIPRDAENLVLIENRRTGETRKLEDGFDKGCEKGGVSESWIFFNDVFVPEDRIFFLETTEFAGPCVMRFAACERSTMGGCVAGQGDIKIGSAVAMSHINGLGSKPFNEKLTRMGVMNETLFGCGAAACALGKKHESGAFFPDDLLSSVTKIHVATLPYEQSVICQEIAGGIGEVGCVPSYQDFMHPELGKLVKKYCKGKASAESRLRVARLIEYATMGLGVPGCMHGGGSPDAAKLVIRRNLDFDGFYLELAKRLADVSEDIRVREEKKK